MKMKRFAFIGTIISLLAILAEGSYAIDGDTSVVRSKELIVGSSPSGQAAYELPGDDSFLPGDNSFKAKIIEFDFKGNDEFLLTLEQLTEFNHTPINPPCTLHFHVRYKPSVRKPKNRHATEKVYLEAVNILLKQYHNGEAIYMGVSCAGMSPIKGTLNEYQSNGLEIEKVTDHVQRLYSEPLKQKHIVWFLPKVE